MRTKSAFSRRCFVLRLFVGITQAHSRFNQQVYAALVRHFDLDTLKVVIIASPGFTKESVYQFILDEAVVSFVLLVLSAKLTASFMCSDKGTRRYKSAAPNSCSFIRLRIMFTPSRRSSRVQRCVVISSRRPPS